MFEVDDFIARCRAASHESEPRLAMKEVLAGAISDPGLVAALPPTRAEIVPLHVDDELTILKVVWAPGMSVGPHDHRTWAAIGVYTGGEDNAFYRRDGATIAGSGGRELRPGDVCLLGDDVIHAVTNPTVEYAAAIHVYRGDFLAMARSEWTGTPLTERPIDHETRAAEFEAANRPPPASS
jgi:predicted metal-dependent enzyme (double-stranded beta helix superfamily)